MAAPSAHDDAKSRTEDSLIVEQLEGDGKYDDLETHEGSVTSDDAAVECDVSKTSNISGLPWFYTSHALFMVNNRCYEFAAVLFTAAAFPQTLVAASIRGLSAHLASCLVSPFVGQWCDRHPSRLRPVLACIIVQRVCIALACVGWILLLPDDHDEAADEMSGKHALFAALVLLGMLERLSAVGNVIMVERDWLPLLALPNGNAMPTSPVFEMAGPEYEVVLEEDAPLIGEAKSKLHILNATAKGIDLVAKLVVPLAISGLVIGLGSERTVAIILTVMQLVSGVFEVYLTKLVWSSCEALQTTKAQAARPEEESTTPYHGINRFSLVRNVRQWFFSIKKYTASPTFPASLAFAIEPFSVLTLAGSMTAYLLVAHFPLEWITAARTASTLVEVSSTVLTPILISYLTRRSPETVSLNNFAALKPLVTAGLLGLSWQLVTLIPATIILMFYTKDSEIATLSTSTLILFASLAISRLGPYAYTLVEQQIVQLEIPEEERMRFSAVEIALYDLAELARWGMLGVFGRPGEFGWVSLTGFGTVGCSLGLFVVWVRGKRRREELYEVLRETM